MKKANSVRGRIKHAASSIEAARDLIATWQSYPDSALVDGFVPREGHIYTVTRAISARINQNFDGFPSSELKAAYKTFLGKPLFVNHANDDASKARGRVIGSRYVENGTDKYIQVIQEVSAKKYPKLAKELEEGGIDAVSMGCVAALTICSVCGNTATDMFDMCDHVLHHKGQTIDGKLVYEECRGIGFFELSYVFDPADETALTSNVIAASRRVGAAPGRVLCDLPGCKRWAKKSDTDRWVHTSGTHAAYDYCSESHRRTFEMANPNWRVANLSKKAYGEIESPERVDTLRDEEDESEFHQFVESPPELRDPDLKKNLEVQHPSDDEAEDPRDDTDDDDDKADESDTKKKESVMTVPRRTALHKPLVVPHIANSFEQYHNEGKWDELSEHLRSLDLPGTASPQHVRDFGQSRGWDQNVTDTFLDAGGWNDPDNAHLWASKKTASLEWSDNGDESIGTLPGTNLNTDTEAPFARIDQWFDDDPTPHLCSIYPNEWDRTVAEKTFATVEEAKMWAEQQLEALGGGQGALFAKRRKTAAVTWFTVDDGFTKGFSTWNPNATPPVGPSGQVVEQVGGGIAWYVEDPYSGSTYAHGVATDTSSAKDAAEQALKSMTAKRKQAADSTKKSRKNRKQAVVTQQMVDDFNNSDGGFSGDLGHGRDDNWDEIYRDYEFGYQGKALGLTRFPGMSYWTQLGYDDAEMGKSEGASLEEHYNYDDDDDDDEHYGSTKTASIPWVKEVLDGNTQYNYAPGGQYSIHVYEAKSYGELDANTYWGYWIWDYAANDDVEGHEYINPSLEETLHEAEQVWNNLPRVASKKTASGWRYEENPLDGVIIVKDLPSGWYLKVTNNGGSFGWSVNDSGGVYIQQGSAGSPDEAKAAAEAAGADNSHFTGNRGRSAGNRTPSAQEQMNRRSTTGGKDMGRTRTRRADQSRNDQGVAEDAFVTQTPPPEPVVAPNEDDPISNTPGNLVAQRRAMHFSRFQRYVAREGGNLRAASTNDIRKWARSYAKLARVEVTELYPKLGQVLEASRRRAATDPDDDGPTGTKAEDDEKDKAKESARRRRAGELPDSFKENADKKKDDSDDDDKDKDDTDDDKDTDDKKKESRVRASTRRRTADDKLEVAAPDGRIDVERPTSGTTDDEAQDSQFDKTDFGNNAGDGVAKPDLSTDQNWAPGDGKKSGAVRKASAAQAVRLAELHIALGIDKEADKWNLVDQFEKTTRATVLDRIALLDRVVEATPARTKTAGVTRGSSVKSAIPQGLSSMGAAPRTAASDNDVENDSLLFLR